MKKMLKIGFCALMLCSCWQINAQFYVSNDDSGNGIHIADGAAIHIANDAAVYIADSAVIHIADDAVINIGDKAYVCDETHRGLKEELALKKETTSVHRVPVEEEAVPVTKAQPEEEIVYCKSLPYHEADSISANFKNTTCVNTNSQTKKYNPFCKDNAYFPGIQLLKSAQSLYEHKFVSIAYYKRYTNRPPPVYPNYLSYLG